jgi:hypothetical protein
MTNVLAAGANLAQKSHIKALFLKKKATADRVNRPFNIFFY